MPTVRAELLDVVALDQLTAEDAGSVETVSAMGIIRGGRCSRFCKFLKLSAWLWGLEVNYAVGCDGDRRQDHKAERENAGGVDGLLFFVLFCCHDFFSVFVFGVPHRFCL